MNWALIAANIIIYALTATNADGSAHGPLAYIRGHAVQEFGALDPSDPKIWQYFSYQFLHEGWMHVLGNMLFLYIFGNNINDRMGNIGYLAFYLAGGVAAGIGHVLTESVPVIGASGAVESVVGAFLVLLPSSNIIIIFFFYLVGVYEIPSLWFVLFTFAEDVIGQVAPGLFGGTEAVAHMAHITGTIFGVVVCLTLMYFRLLPRDPMDALSMISRWNRRRQYRMMVRGGYNPFGHSPVPASGAGPMRPPPPPDPMTQQMLDLRAQISMAAANHDLPSAAALYLQLAGLSPRQVMPKRTQLDIANQLASQQQYMQAAEAYERFLAAFPTFEQIEQVELMLGVIYARYLGKYERARDLLKQSLTRLHSEREINWVREELARIEALIPPSATGGK